jgi:hypothetical protein
MKKGKMMSSKGIFTLFMLSGLSVMWIFGTQFNEIQAQPKKGKLCYQVVGKTMKGGILNETDYIQINKTKITGFELSVGNHPKKIDPSFKKFARQITLKVPNVKASFQPDPAYSTTFAAVKLVLQSTKKIKVHVFGPYASEITGLKTATTQVRSIKCSK